VTIPDHRVAAAGSRAYRDAAAAAISDARAPLAVDGASRAGFVQWIADSRLGVLLQETCRAASRANPIWIQLSPAIHGELAVSALQERELRRLFDAFTAAEISPILLKGAALAYSLYENPAVRPRGDVDFLIRAADEPAIRRVLTELGYRSELDVPVGLVSNQFHFSRSDRFGVLHMCDVHLRMSNALAYSDYLTYDEIRGEAIRCPRLHPAALAPAPFHSLVIACVHRIAHHYDVDDLIWLWDIDRLASALGEEDWARVLELCRARRLAPAVVRGLERAREAFGGVAFEPVIARLAAEAARADGTRPEFGQHTTMLDVVASDWRSLDHATDRVQLMRDHLFPPLSYLRRKYPRWPAALLPLAYVYRIGRGAPKWLRPRRH